MYKDITVTVPSDKITEFYEIFSNWLAEISDSAQQPKKWEPGDLDKAILVYAKLSHTARDIFEIFLDRPNKEISAEKVTKKARLKTGVHGLAGTLAWPGRHCYSVGREPFLTTRTDEDQGTFFSMTKEVAELLKQAKEVVD